MHKQLRKMVILAIMLTLTGACSYYFFLFSPELIWDKSPQTLVIYTGINQARHIDYNYIPDFQLWGDGRVIWVTHYSDGKRKVFEGLLSEKDIFNILEKLKDAGFYKSQFNFDRKEVPYCNYQGFEDGIIYVKLLHNRYSQIVSTKDREICDAINDLVTGTGIEGQEYAPTEGKIYFAPIEKTDLPLDAKAVYQWSDADFPFRPEMIASSDKNGMVITGEELRLAWDIVNQSSQPVVDSNGKKFWMAVVITWASINT